MMLFALRAFSMDHSIVVVVVQDFVADWILI